MCIKFLMQFSNLRTLDVVHTDTTYLVYRLKLLRSQIGSGGGGGAVDGPRQHLDGATDEEEG